MASGRTWPIFEDENAFAKENHIGQWRLEVKYKENLTSNRFLHLIEASDTGKEQMIKSTYVRSDNRDGVEFTDRSGRKWRVMFNSAGALGGTIQAWDGDISKINATLNNE